MATKFRTTRSDAARSWQRKAGTPPRRSESGGALPSWLDPQSAAWPEARVSQIDKRHVFASGPIHAGTDSCAGSRRLPDL